ncbi:Crp/Fnr family transcriptional regulator [Sinanaerobacter chloroacetimidivorans]|jgi:CRP/FNR family transcriptional regulator|uniref:Crp/Fnr family transcriptional regulator n=1 Tax=Sinanaerobacter chloroacetimidivorans TaxID=2818044 RepID=A0A8J7W1G2_9FIRM|nr:Crp/Fnr family transcriptional regulator [Sinanaerobacter chloroacetimidivorans]MBR0599069.1 Crp/Fnr family transcriptional regulator [Sinanaerobacter chloroacetimidivorans]
MDQEDKKLLSELLPFWKNLKENEKRQVMDHTILHAYKNGEQVHGGYEDCTGVIAVKKGRIRVYLLSEEGKEVTLFRLLENDICLLSASCILRNISFDIYVDAEGDTELFVLNSSVYDKLAKENPAVGNFMTDLISMRFSEAMWVMEQILFMKLDKRLAMFLLEQANLENGDVITLTHEQIAGHMGSAREVISRMLKYFSNEGIVNVSRKGIKIVNRKKLTEYL